MRATLLRISPVRTRVSHAPAQKSAAGKILRVDSAEQQSVSATKERAASAPLMVENEASRKKAAQPSHKAKVQLRLSRSLIRVLMAFQKAGQDPGDLTERSLWQNSSVRDAAGILGIRLRRRRRNSQ